MDNPIVEACQKLYAERLNIACVTARKPLTSNAVTITISLANYGPAAEMGPNLPSGQSVNIDKHGLPVGITCRDITRYPDYQEIIITDDIERLMRDTAEQGDAYDLAIHPWPELGYTDYMAKPRRWRHDDWRTGGKFYQPK